MKSYLRNLLKVMSVSVFVCGLALLSWKVYSKQLSSPQARQSFVMLREYQEIENGESRPVTRTSTIAFNAKLGKYKITTYDLTSGKTRVTVGDPVAFYNVRDKDLQYVDYGDHMNEFNNNSLSESFFRSNPLFTREDKVAGLKVFVFRDENEESWNERYHSPLTGFFALKRVTFDKESKVESIEETVSVQFRDLSESEYQAPDLPVHFNEAESWIGSLRASGSPNNIKQAEDMSQRLVSVKQKLNIK
jgi:hypothetical protein